MSTLIGLDCNLASNSASYTKPEFVSAINSIKPDVCRTPGSEADNYWWRQETAKPRIDEVLLMQKVVDCKMIYVMNMITRGLKNNLAMLHYADSIGLPIDFIEFGNELNVSPAGQAKFPNALSYAQTCKQWAMIFKSEFPDTKLLCVGEDKGQTKWNETVLENIPDVLLVSHWHCNSQYVFDGVPNVDIIKADIDRGLAEYMPGIPAGNIFMTEFNLQQGQHEYKKLPDFKDEAAMELATTTMLQKFTEIGLYGACFHNVVGFEDGAILSNRWTGTVIQPAGNAIKKFIEARI